MKPSKRGGTAGVSRPGICQGVFSLDLRIANVSESPGVAGSDTFPDTNELIRTMFLMFVSSQVLVAHFGG